MKYLRTAYYYYQRAMWYMGHAKGEITKPLQFWNETLLILTYLSIKGTELDVKWVVLAYATVFLFVVFIGKIIVRMGVVNYNMRLSNSQNPELLEILASIKEIKQDIKSLNKSISK